MKFFTLLFLLSSYLFSLTSAYSYHGTQGLSSNGLGQGQPQQSQIRANPHPRAQDTCAQLLNTLLNLNLIQQDGSSYSTISEPFPVQEPLVQEPIQQVVEPLRQIVEPLPVVQQQLEPIQQQPEELPEPVQQIQPVQISPVQARPVPIQPVVQKPAISSGSGQKNVFQAPISSKHSVEVKPVQMEQRNFEPAIIEVNGGFTPVELLFRTKSATLKVRQEHKSRPLPEVEQTSSNDEPYRVSHQVTRPVIQEIREIIQPYRKVLQQVQPVQEQIVTLIAKRGQEGAGEGSGNGAGIGQGSYAISGAPTRVRGGGNGGSKDSAQYVGVLEGFSNGNSVKY